VNEDEISWGNMKVVGYHNKKEVEFIDLRNYPQKLTLKLRENEDVVVKYPLKYFGPLNELASALASYDYPVKS
jgi:hypothetical protein